MLYNSLTAAVIFILASTNSMAAMTISGTRVIFPGDNKEVTVRTNNKGKTPSLVQVWVDDGHPDTDVNTMKVPFLVTPPVYRVEPGKGQSLRLIYNNMVLPKDRESVFWLNMLEIPPVYKGPAKDRLELAFRTRIKIFYRPASLEKSSSSGEARKLEWSIVKGGGKLKITNPTPYYYSFESIVLNSGSKKVNVESEMLAPYTTAEFSFEKKSPSVNTFTGGEFKLLNDYGAVSVGTLKATNKGLTLDGLK